MKGFLGWKLMAVGIALVLLAGSAGAGSVEKNGISVELLENKRISAFAGIAVVNITAKKNYDFKTTDLLATFKKFDLNSPEKGVYSDAKPVLWQVLEEFNYSNSVIRFVGNGTFLNATDSLTNKTSLQEQLVAKNFSYWHYAFREVTDKTKFKLKNGESIKLKFVGDLLKPRVNYDWIITIDSDEWEEFAWWNATSTTKREVTYTHNAFLATNPIDYPLRVNASTNDYNCLGQDYSNTGESASLPSSYASKTGSCRTQSPVTFVRVPLLNSTNQSTYWYRNMTVTTTNETDSFATFNNSYEEVYFAPDLRSWGGRANAITAGASVSNATGLWGANAWNLSEGTNRYFTLASIASFQTNNSFAVKAWVWNDDSGASAQNMVFSCRNTADGIPIIAMYSSGSATGCTTQKQAFLIRDNANVNTWMCGVNNYAYGVWHYYVWSYDSVADQATGYVDGVREINAATSNFGASTFDRCTIGVDAYNPTVSNDQVDGRINNVFVLNRTVSWDEVLADYNSTQLAFGAETLSSETTVPNASIIFPANNTNSSGMNSTSGLLNVSISVNDNVGLSGINATILYTNATGGLQRSMGNQSAVPNNSITYLTRVFPANTDSQFRWLVEVSDNATTPNVVNSSLNFITIDNVNPSSFTFVGVTPGNATNVSSASQTFNFTFNETHMNSGALGTCIVSYNQSVNSTPFIPVAGNSSNCGLTNSSLITGSQFVVAYANDSMGNWGVSSARHFLVDTSAPSISALTTYPANNSFFNATFNASFQADVSDTPSGLNRTLIQVDGVNYTAYNPSGVVRRYALNNVLSGATPDPHSWSVYAEDFSANWAWSGNQSYSIQRGVTAVNLSIGSIELNRTIAFTTSDTNVSAHINSTTGQTASLYQNGTVEGSGTDFFILLKGYSGGAYRFTANSTVNSNWTASYLDRLLIVDIGSISLGVFLNGTNLDRTYDTATSSHEINATYNHSGGSGLGIDFYRNGTVLDTNPHYWNVSANTFNSYNFTAIFNATTNYSRAYVERTATISGALGSVGGGGGGGGGMLPTPTPVVNATNQTIVQLPATPQLPDVFKGLDDWLRGKGGKPLSESPKGNEFPNALLSVTVLGVFYFVFKERVPYLSGFIQQDSNVSKVSLALAFVVFALYWNSFLVVSIPSVPTG